jgi:glycosyltransferase involved in cell wall biosynthesis
MAAKITIGLPFFNPGQHFRVAIQSIFAQSFTDWKLILVDDGSTDDSLAFARSLRDERVQVYSDGSRRGLNIRLNQIAHVSESTFLARMDADDIMVPHRLELQHSILLQRAEETILGSAAYSIDGQSRILGYKATEMTQQRGFEAQYSFIHPTVIGPTAWFRRNPYSEDPVFVRGQDTELWCRTTASSRFMNIKDPLLFYREPDAFSFKNYLSAKVSGIVVLSQHFRSSRISFVWGIARELGKIWISALFDAYGFSSKMISKRYRTLSQEELALANAALENVRQQRIPV